MPTTLLSKKEILLKLFSLFRRAGYDGATLAKISRDTGLGRASLYHHFPGGKKQMADEVLKFVRQWNDEEIIKPLSGKGKPKQKLEKMTAVIRDLYQDGQNGCIIGAFAAGDTFPLFQETIKEILSRWIDAITDVLVEEGIDRKVAQTRAEDALSKIQGALILTRGIGQRRVFGRLIKNLPSELLSKSN